MIEIFETCQTKSIAKQTNRDESLIIRSIAGNGVYLPILIILIVHVFRSCLPSLSQSWLLSQSTTTPTPPFQNTRRSHKCKEMIMESVTEHEMESKK